MIGYASGLSAWSRSRKAVTDSLPCLCFLLSGALAVVSEGVDAVFHLAAVDSGAADANFDLGMKVNFDATRAVLTRCRRLEVRPLKLLYLACELWSMACELWSMACALWSLACELWFMACEIVHYFGNYSNSLTTSETTLTSYIIEYSYSLDTKSMSYTIIYTLAKCAEAV
jgi:hypothetical protein